jgi:DNA polymerase epsilon subunit 2
MNKVTREKNQDARIISEIKSIFGKKGQHLLLGYISLNENKEWILKDFSGELVIDLKEECKNGDAFYTLHSFLLVEGEYVKDKFIVSKIAQPPLQDPLITKRIFPNFNFFGSVNKFDSISKIRELEKEDGDAMFVILSDVFLDDKKVLDSLDQIFSGYNDFAPSAFIFMGSFISNNKIEKKEYLSHFNSLHSILSKYKNIFHSSHFIFVPGPNDPTLSSPFLFPQRLIFFF